MRKGLLALIFSLLAVVSSRSQNLDFQLNPYVANDTLFIEYYVTDNGLVSPPGEGFGPSELPIYFDDTTLIESGNFAFTARGVWDAALTPGSYDPMTAGFSNDSVFNLLINPILPGPDPQSIISGGPQQPIATIAFPIQNCGDINVNWVPTGLANSGARLLWDGTDISNAGTNYLANASPNPVSLSIGSLLVTTLNDEGCGSLREAINYANTNPGPDTITFDPGLLGGIIFVGNTSGLPLPDLTDDSTFIDAQIDPNNCVPDITIDGSDVNLTTTSPGSAGLILSSSSGSTIQELVIQNFEDDGIRLQFAATYNNILSCHIGVDQSGTVANGNTGTGVFITQDSRFNVISESPTALNCIPKTIISNNSFDGVFIDILCDSNYISSSNIGTGIAGTESFGNGENGIEILSSGNQIGDAAGTYNIISANTEHGIDIDGGAGNIIQNNRIGVNELVIAANGNGGDGIAISNGGTLNIIGGDQTLTEGNYIGGNTLDGISIEGASFNSVAGNIIGVNITGTGDIPNGNGVYLSGSSGNFIGTGQANEGNVISGNNLNGVLIEGLSTNTAVLGNIIGLNQSANGDRGNTLAGVRVENATTTYIGGASTDSLNVISGNGGSGIEIENSDTTLIAGNRIGTDLFAIATFGNDVDGISISGGSFLTIVGTASSGASFNYIGGNAQAGVSVVNSDTTFIRGNIIGVDATGTGALPNGNEGVFVSSSSLVVVGDTGTFETNIISGNLQQGITFNNVTNSYIAGNIIGKDGTASSAIPNGAEGIYINGTSTNDTIVFNQIAYNNGDGILFDGATTQDNIVWYNSIHSNAALGIEHLNGSQNNIPLPVITSLSVVGTDTILSGTSAPGALIQIYCDSLHEGEVIYDTTLADVGGNWSKVINGYGANMNNGLDSITVLMDEAGNTSKFSAPIYKVVSCTAPVVSLGNDTSFCTGDSVQLSVYDYGIGSTYTWYAISGGPVVVKTSTSNTDTTYYATMPETYVVEVDSAGTGCVGSDTIVVNEVAAPVVDLGNDTTVCGNTYTLEAGPNIGSTYTWTDSTGATLSTGVDDSTYVANTDHKYFVTADNGACTVTDSVTVSFNTGLATPFNAVYSSSTGTSVTFVFDSVPDVLNYTVYVDTCGGGGGCTPYTGSPFTVASASSPESFTVSPMNLLDSAVFWVRANGPCDSIWSDTATGVADTCNANFTGLDSSLCSSSLLQRLYPDFAGGTFTASPVPTAVQYAGAPLDFWYFDPSEAGPGYHTVYYTACSGASIDSFTTYIQPAPCISTVLKDSTSSAIVRPQGLFTTCEGLLYVTSSDNQTIVVVDTFGFASVFIGDSSLAGANVDGPRATARVHDPIGLAVAPNGDIYFVDGGSHTVRMYDAGTDAVTTIAGVPNSAGSTDNNIGSVVQFNQPFGLALSPALDRLWVTEKGTSRIREIELTSGTYFTQTVAGGGGTAVFNGDVVTGTSAIFSDPGHIVADNNYVYFTEEGLDVVYRYDLATLDVEIMAGRFNNAGSTDGDTSIAQFSGPLGISVTCSGNLYVADAVNNAIRLVDGDTIPGNLYVSSIVECANPGCFPPVAGDLQNPTALSVFVRGYVDVADTDNDDIKRFQIEDFESRPWQDVDTFYCMGDPIDTLNSATCGINYSGNGITVAGSLVTFDPNAAGPGTHTLTYNFSQGFCSETITFDVTVYPAASVSLGPDTVICQEGLGIDSLIVDSNFASIQWTVNAAAALADTNYWRITDVAGEYIVDVIDTNGCVAADTTNLTIAPLAEVTITSDMTDSICYGDTAVLSATNTGAGPGFLTYAWNTGDTTSTVQGYFSGDFTVDVVDSNGCIADTSYRSIVRNAPAVCIGVNSSLTGPSGARYGEWSVSTIAGDTNIAPGQANGQAYAASFTSPWDVYFDNGFLYVTESVVGGQVRRIDLSDTTVTTYIGGGASGTADSIGRLNASMDNLTGIHIHNGDFYFIQDNGLHYLDVAKDSVYHITGGGTTFMNGHISVAEFNAPQDITMDGFGNVFVADYGNHLIRGVYIDDTVRTLAGIPSFGGNVTAGSPGISRANNPWGVGLDPAGQLYVGHESSHAISHIDLDTVQAIDVPDNGGGLLPYFTNTAQGSGVMAGTWNVVSDKTGKIFTTEGVNHLVSVLSPFDSLKSITGDYGFAVVGSPGYADGLGGTARFNTPSGITLDPETGDLYVADRNNHLIRKLTQNKTISICSYDTVDVDGSCPNAVSYNWSGPVVLADPTNPVQSFTDPGTYILTVQDAAGCSNSDSIIISLNADPAFAYMIQDTTMCQADSIDLIAQSTVATDTVFWTDPMGVVVSFGLGADTITIDSSGIGTYTATLSNGCTLDSTVTVSVNDLMADAVDYFTGADTSRVCFGDTAVLSARGTSGGTTPYSYLWTGTGGSVVGATNLDTVVGVIGGVTPGSLERYYVTVTDSIGCSQTDSTLVYWADSLNINVGNDTAICANSLITVTATVNLGIAPYSPVSWVDTSGVEVFADGNSITGNPPDTTAYVATVTDAIGCTATDSITIYPVDVIVDAGVDDTICPGGTSTLTATVTSGIGPYSYAWTPAASLDDSTLQSPTAGPAATTQYIVSVYDSTLACSSTDTVNVIVNDLQAIAGVVDGINNPNDTLYVCVGDSATLDASLTSGGVTPYASYNWTASGSFTGTIVNAGLVTTQAHSGTPGSYDLFYVEVTDGTLPAASACTDIDSVVVFWNNVLTVNAGTDSTICLGNSIDLTGVSAGGTLPYADESWIDTSGTEVFAGNTNPITVTPPDTTAYVMTVTDALGCTAFDSVTVYPVDLTVDAGIDDTICPGGNTMLTATVTVGVGPYTYAWTPAASLDDSTLQSPTASPTTTTQYVVQVTDAGLGCAETDTVNVVVNDLQAIAGVVDGINDPNDTLYVCVGDSATLDASLSNGGVAPYASYNWTASGGFAGAIVDPTLVTTQAHSGTPGTYDLFYVEVTDGTVPAGCTDTDSVVVFWNNVLTVNAGTDSTICLGNSIDLTGVSAGGTLPYADESWIDTSGTEVFIGNTNPITVTPPDTTAYVMTVTDALGCTAFDSVTVYPVDLTVDAGIDDTICPGGNTMLTATVTVGVGPYTYAWTPAASLDDSTLQSPTASPTSTTQYVVEVTDAGLGCTDSDTVNVVVNDLQAIAGVVDGINDPNDTLYVCVGDTATLDASLTNSGEPAYTYLWSPAGSFTGTLPSNTNQTEIAFGGTPGTYDLFYVDVADQRCVDTDSLVVFWNNVLTLTATADTSICLGNSVDLTAVAGGGTAPYSTLTWVDTSGVEVFVAADTITANPLDTTAYVATVTDALGCTAFDSVTVYPVDLTVDAGIDDTICPGGNTMLTATVTVGVGPYTYAWTPAASLDDSTLQSPTASPTTTTQYVVQVTDAGLGCAETDTVNVVVNDLQAIAGVVDGINDPNDTLYVCVGDSATLDASLSNGGVAPYASYNWTASGGFAGAIVDPTLVTTQAHSGTPGTYDLFYVEVTDGTVPAGCTDIDSVVVFWNNVLTVNAGTDSTICLGNSIDLTGVSAGGTLPYADESWIDTSGTEVFVGNTNPITVTPPDTTAYVMTVTDALGCTAFDSVTVYPVDLTVDAGIDDTICPGGNTMLTATVTVGVGPYTYAWTPAASLDDSTLQSPTATPTATTQYVVQVTDAGLGCADTDTVNVVVNDLQAIAGVVDGLSPADTITVCFGDTATLDASLTNGGEPGYNFFWYDGGTFTGTQPSNINQTEIAFGGTPGTYDLFYVDVADLRCVDTDSLVVYWNTEIITDGTPDTAYTCSGGSDSIFASAVGGDGSYGFVWNTVSGTAAVANPTGTSTIVTASDTSLVELVATDGLGCSDADTITVMSVDFVVDAFAQFDTICPNLDDTLGVNIVSGGVGPYTYAWNPSADLNDTTLAQPVANISATTTFDVTVTDNTTGCTNSDNITVTVLTLIAEAGTILDPIDDTLTACFDDTLSVSGTLSSGGTPFNSGLPYTFAWTVPVGINVDGGLADSVVRVSGGAIGTTSEIDLMITDSLGCTATDSVYVYWNDQITINVAPAILHVCNSDTGSITATAAGGTAPLSYLWTTQSGTATFVDPTANPVEVMLNDTSVVVGTATDARGCSESGFAIVRNVNFSSSITASTNSACENQFDTLTAVPAGGSGTFTYSWSNGSTADTAIISEPTVGTYTYSVDINDVVTSCTLTDSITIDIYNMSVFAGNDTILCNANNPFQLQGQITGGVGGFQHIWSTPNDTANYAYNDTTIINPTFAIPATRDNVPWYHLLYTAVDANGCVRTDTMRAALATQFVLFDAAGANDPQNICEGDSIRLGSVPGTTFQNVVGGIPVISYLWSSTPGGTNVDGATASHPYFVPTTAGSYVFNLSATDSLGCSATGVFDLTVNVSAAPSVELGSDTFYCTGSSVDIANTLANGAGTSYEWRQGGLTGAVVGTPDSFYTANAADIYYLIATNGIGCRSYDSINVNEELLPSVTMTLPASNPCNNSNFNLTGTIVSGSVNPVISWTTSNGTGVINEPDSLSTFYIPNPGSDPNPIDFTLTYTTFCGTDTQNGSVTTITGATAVISASPLNVFPGDQVTLVDSTAGTVVNHYWAFGTGTTPDSAFTAGPHFVDYNTPGLITATMIIEDNNGCFDTATVVIDVVSTKIIYIPNVMAPMANNVENQVAKVYGVNISNNNFEFTVYNRWGELIYQTTDFNLANTVGWDGIHQTTGQPQDAGVYTYSVKGEFYDGETFEKTGTITIIR